eukprot:TRINITY_DN64427_c0_g1_i1.p1 TRINITY_DN64427_c0_g1~~TRINITY_DN64427_c0_g1_i1.p1  ORF type:complete len:440 (-),score=57.02 TRINITY_DN64427_c0_g1_i1:956-2275(-)
MLTADGRLINVVSPPRRTSFQKITSYFGRYVKGARTSVLRKAEGFIGVGKALQSRFPFAIISDDTSAGDRKNQILRSRSQKPCIEKEDVGLLDKCGKQHEAGAVDRSDLVIRNLGGESISISFVGAARVSDLRGRVARACDRPCLGFTNDDVLLADTALLVDLAWGAELVALFEVSVPWAPETVDIKFRPSSVDHPDEIVRDALIMLGPNSRNGRDWGCGVIAVPTEDIPWERFADKYSYTMSQDMIEEEGGPACLVGKCPADVLWLYLNFLGWNGLDNAAAKKGFISLGLMELDPSAGTSCLEEAYAKTRAMSEDSVPHHARYSPEDYPDKTLSRNWITVSANLKKAEEAKTLREWRGGNVASRERATWQQFLQKLDSCKAGLASRITHRGSLAGVLIPDAHARITHVAQYLNNGGHYVAVFGTDNWSFKMTYYFTTG